MNKILWNRVFLWKIKYDLWNKTWYILLEINHFTVLEQKSQNLRLLLLQDLGCLTLLSLHLFMLYFASFPFIVFFLQVFWFKFATLPKFSSNKTNKNQPLLNYTFFYVFIPSVTFVLHLTFFVSPNLSIAFFSFLELSFFRFR